MQQIFCLRTVLITAIFVLSTPIQCKVQSTESIIEDLRNMTNKELQQEYKSTRKWLVLLPDKSLIETTVAFTQKPVYKMGSFNMVVREIARRCEQAKTIEELASFADLFFIRDTKVPKGKGQRRKRRRRASNNTLIAR